MNTPMLVPYKEADIGERYLAKFDSKKQRLLIVNIRRKRMPTCHVNEGGAADPFNDAVQSSINRYKTNNETTTQVTYK